MLVYLLKNKEFLSKFVLIAFIISISSNLFAGDDIELSVDAGIFEKISTQYLPSLTAHERADELVSKKSLSEKTTLSGVGIVESLKLIYDIFSDSRLKESMGDYCGRQLLDDCIFKDLEIFCGNKDAANSLFSNVDLTMTPWGRAKLQSLFFKKFDDFEFHINGIRDMQKKVRFLVENEEVFKKIDEELTRLGAASSEVMWMWKVFDESGFGYWDKAFFHRHEHEILDSGKKLVVDFTSLNESEMSLQSALVAMAFIAPLIVPVASTGWAIYSGIKLREALADDTKKFRTKNNCITNFLENIENKVSWDKWGNKAIIGSQILMCFLSVYMGFVSAHDMLASANAVHRKMNNVVSFIDASSNVEMLLRQDTLFDEIIKSSHYFGNKFISNKEVAEFGVLTEKLLASDVYKNDPKFFTNKGKILASFKKIMRMKSGLISSFLMIGEIDMLMSIAKLYKKYQTHNSVKYCFAEFVSADKPYINIHNFWHPFINEDDVVSNGIELGTQSTGRGVILTGPNAAGKSSALKGLITVIILAHTLGIVPADKAVMTPFCKIDSHLNVTDEQGKESLFQAEMNRALKFLDDVKSLKKGEFMFTILDELFSSTNPEEGMSGAYGIIKSLADYPNCMSVLATHFKKLTELELQTDGFFKNYKVYVDVFADGSFRRPFKLVQGISDQSMALLLMYKQGFDRQIVEDAFDVLARVKGDKRNIIMPVVDP